MAPTLNPEITASLQPWDLNSKEMDIFDKGPQAPFFMGEKVMFNGPCYALRLSGIKTNNWTGAEEIFYLPQPLLRGIQSSRYALASGPR
jgi:hypothetical protein